MTQALEHTTVNVYEAEKALRFMLDHPGSLVTAFGSVFTVPTERKFGDLAGVQRYVNLVWEREAPAGTKAPAVRERGGNRAAHYEPLTHVIAVPGHEGVKHSWAMRETVVLHELAHALTRTAEDVGGHGPEFTQKFVDLVTEYIAPEAGFILSVEYAQRGVQIGNFAVK